MHTKNFKLPDTWSEFTEGLIRWHNEKQHGIVDLEMKPLKQALNERKADHDKSPEQKHREAIEKRRHEFEQSIRHLE